MNSFLVVSSLSESLDAIDVEEDPEYRREAMYFKLTKCYNQYGDFIGSFFKTTYYKIDTFEFIPVGYQVYCLEGEIVAIP